MPGMSDAVHSAAELLRCCGSPSAVLPPTALYNEGWMLRLVLNWFAHQPPGSHPLSFSRGARWFSEALLPTQFSASTRGDQLAEAWTHADGVVGHFQMVDGRGDVRLDPGARQFVVTEAKMFSGLSAGTKHARAFNQAARTVACMAEVLHRTETSASAMENLGFVVLAPAEQVELGIFRGLTSKDHIREAVRQRAANYGGAKDAWFVDVFLPLLERLDVHVLTWDQVVATIAETDRETARALGGFLAQCLRFNRRSNLTRVTP